MIRLADSYYGFNIVIKLIDLTSLRLCTSAERVVCTVSCLFTISIISRLYSYTPSVRMLNCIIIVIIPIMTAQVGIYTILNSIFFITTFTTNVGFLIRTLFCTSTGIVVFFEYSTVLMSARCNNFNLSLGCCPIKVFTFFNKLSCIGYRTVYGTCCIYCYGCYTGF